MKFSVSIQLKGHDSKTVLDSALWLTTFNSSEFSSPINKYLGQILDPFNIRTRIDRVVSFSGMVDY